MLDTLVLHIPMKAEFTNKSGNLTSIRGDVADYQVAAVPSYLKRDLNGEITYGELRHPYESLPTSFSGMAMKFNANNVANTLPYVSLNASVKILQGHNVYGTSTVQNLGKEMIGMLAAYYPMLFTCLDIKSVSISRIDSTYSVVMPNKDLIQPALKYLSNVAVGHRKSDTQRDFYNTVYFGGKTSRNGGAKIYGKGNEVNEYVNKLKIKAKTDLRSANQLAVYTPELVEYASNLLRLESSTKRRKLESLLMTDNIDNFWNFCSYENDNPEVLRVLWSSWFDPIIGALKGSVIRNVDDSDILDLLKQKLFSIKGVKLTKKLRFKYVLPPPPLDMHPNHKKRAEYRVSDVPVRVYTKAHNAFNFYQLIRLNGYDVVKARMNARTFQINVKTLVDSGISKSDLQNLHLKNDDSYDISSLISVDFDSQVPDGYQTPLSVHYDSFNDGVIYKSHIPVTSIKDELDEDTGVLSIDEVNDMLMSLGSHSFDDFDTSIYDDVVDNTPIYDNDSPVMSLGQLNKLISK